MEIVSKKDFSNTYKSKFYFRKAYKKYGYLIPIKVSDDLIKIFARLITDGFMDIRKKGKNYYYGYIGYFSKNERELKIFNNLFYREFKIKGRIREWGIRKTGKSKGCIILNAAICRILNLCGVPGGNKTGQRYSLPSWILKSNKNNQAIFLKRIFSCEGSVDKETKTGRWEIRYPMYKLDNLSKNTIKFLNDLRSILLRFNIITSNPFIPYQYIRKRDKKLITGYVIKIRRKDSIINFNKYIGFDISYKQKRLNQAAKELLQ